MEPGLEPGGRALLPSPPSSGAGAGPRGRVLGVGERPGSLEAGLGELAPRGAGLQRPRDLRFGLRAPQSPQFPPLWWPRGPAGSPGVRGPLGPVAGAGPAFPFPPSVGPGRPGQRGHGTFSRRRGVGDHSLGEPPGPWRRRQRPAFEEVGQTWAGPQPRIATLLPSAHFVVSLSTGPAGRPSAPRLPRLRGPSFLPTDRAAPGPSPPAPTPALRNPVFSRSSEADPRPASQASGPLRRLHRVRLPWERLSLRRTRARARCGDVRIAPGSGGGSSSPPRPRTLFSARPASGRSLQPRPVVGTGLL
jgi:hypothetical protein